MFKILILPSLFRNVVKWVLIPLKISKIASLVLHSYYNSSEIFYASFGSNTAIVFFPFFLDYGIFSVTKVFKASVKFPFPTFYALSKAYSAPVKC